MKLKYVGPHDEVELLDGTLVKRNHTVDVADDVAGRGPDPRLELAMLELHDAVDNHDHPGAVKLRHEITTLDYGTGLLAQSDNWQAVVPAGKKKDEVAA